MTTIEYTEAIRPDAVLPDEFRTVIDFRSRNKEADFAVYWFRLRGYTITVSVDPESRSIILDCTKNALKEGKHE